MKFILLIVLTLINGSVFSASVISYTDKTKDENKFRVINSSQIAAMYFDEEDQELSISVPGGPSLVTWTYSVKTVSEAKIIMRKILDPNDLSLIELKTK